MKDKLVENMEKGAFSEPPPGSGDEDGNHGDTEEDVITWVEFTENTTFHGIKYIFDHKPYGFRRALWFICVLAAVGVFAYAGIVRLFAYTDHKATVNMQVTYPKKLDFPAVTICNQNSQRLTKAVEYRLYSYIDAFFSYDPHLERFGNLSHINTSEFVRDAAHRRDDFIDKCIWKKKDCRVQMRRELTDAGICYTFTPDDRAVTSPGSRFGLRLVLNVEQYEYMKNDQDDVGVKVLLHDPLEKPQIRDQGFVVEPGKHTLVAIKKIKFSGIGKPFDGTSKTAEPLANCQLDCEAANQKRRCECTNVYMSRNETDPPTCGMRKQFECILAADDDSTPSTDCSCLVPSQRESYEPRLSTALLSKYNINQVAFSQPYSRNDTMMKYIRARDTAQRALAEVRSKNIELIDTLWNHTKQLQSELKLYSEILNNASSLAAYGGTLNIFDKSIRDEFTDTRAVTDHMFKGRQAHFQRLPDAPDLGKLYNMIDDILRRVINVNALDSLVKCVDEEQISPNQVLQSSNEDGEGGQAFCPKPTPAPPPPARDGSQQEGSKDPHHHGTNTHLDGHQMTGDRDNTHHQPNQQPPEEKMIRKKREIQNRERSILKRYDSSSNSSSLSNPHSGFQNSSDSYSSSPSVSGSSSSPLNSYHSSPSGSYYPSSSHSYHSSPSNSYYSSPSNSYHSSPSNSYYPSSSTSYYSSLSNSYYSSLSNSYYSSPSNSYYSSPSNSYYSSPSNSYYSSPSNTYYSSPSNSAGTTGTTHGTTETEAATVTTSPPDLTSITSDNYPGYSDSYTSSDLGYSFTTPDNSSSTNPPYPSVTDGTTYETTETDFTPQTTSPPDFTSPTLDYYPGSFSDSYNPSPSESYYPFTTDLAYTSPSDSYTSSDQDYSSTTSDAGSDSTGICYTVDCQSGASSTCITAPVELPALDEITMAAIEPACITVFTSYSSYTLAQQTTSSRFYYNVNSMTDGEHGTYPDGSGHDPNWRPGPPPANDNGFMNGSHSLEDAVTKPPLTFPPEISGECNKVKYLICGRGHQSGPHGGHNVTQALSGFRARYMEEMVAIFNDKTQLFSDQQLHKNCLVELDKLDRLTPDLESVYEQIVNMKKAETVQELMDALGPITNSSPQIRWVLDEAKTVDMEQCMWFKRYWLRINGKTRAETDVTQYVQQAQQANVFLLSQPNEITLLRASLKSIRNALNKRIMSYFNQLMKFKNGTFEKSVLTEKYDTFQVKVDLTKISTNMDDFTARARDWKQSMGTANTHLTVWYKYILKSMMVPLVTDKNVKDLPVVKTISKVSSLKSTLDAVTKDPTKAYEIPGQVISPLEGVPMSISQNLTAVLSALITAEEHLRDNLDSYSKGNKIADTFFMENFLQLDLYYPELSYQTIEYQEAFTFVSLLSEIGGFMGLLLGASVLTVCEVADFIFLQCVNAWGPKKAKKYKK